MPSSPARIGPEFEQTLNLIGRLNYIWTNTESVLIHVIAGLSSTDKDTATIIFLTLNTTRARLNLVERLAKMEKIAPALRDDILSITRDLSKSLALKNRLNHCIYAFDDEGSAKSILMRVQDSAKAIRYGKEQSVDEKSIAEMTKALAELQTLNKRIWALVLKEKFPV